jgi:hypothetical protein
MCARGGLTTSQGWRKAVFNSNPESYDYVDSSGGTHWYDVISMGAQQLECEEGKREKSRKFMNCE